MVRGRGAGLQQQQRHPQLRRGPVPEVQVPGSRRASLGRRLLLHPQGPRRGSRERGKLIAFFFSSGPFCVGLGNFAHPSLNSSGLAGNFRL